MKTNVYIDTPDRLDAGYAITLPNGLVFSRSLSRHEYLRSQVMSVVSSTNGAPVETFNYTYDALCRPVSRNGDTFGYNARSEVSSCGLAGGWQRDYLYDEIGNPQGIGANCLNQSSVCGYDVDVNMISNFYNLGFGYDARSRLISASDLVFTNNECRLDLVVSNRYDHIGRRVKKTTPAATHTFFYDSCGSLWWMECAFRAPRRSGQGELRFGPLRPFRRDYAIIVRRITCGLSRRTCGRQSQNAHALPSAWLSG